MTTGSGKTMILYCVRIDYRRLFCHRLIVVSPVKSIVEDQIAAIRSLNCTAVELTDKIFADVVKSQPQFIYCTAVRG
jgi:ERCC4-related helicase